MLTQQTSAGVELINAEQGAAVGAIAQATSAEGTVARLDAILAARTALETNVAPLLAMESLLISLADSR